MRLASDRLDRPATYRGLQLHDLTSREQKRGAESREKRFAGKERTLLAALGISTALEFWFLNHRGSSLTDDVHISSLLLPSFLSSYHPGSASVLFFPSGSLAPLLSLSLTLVSAISCMIRADLLLTLTLTYDRHFSDHQPTITLTASLLSLRGICAATDSPDLTYGVCVQRPRILRSAAALCRRRETSQVTSHSAIIDPALRIQPVRAFHLAPRRT
ncbi:hypothetical protein BDW62DRAFT_51729 [Aspergillus aurantiobrunneus]